VTFKFWELLKNASEVSLVPKNIFFLKILNLVQSFVECKVSLADGTVRTFNVKKTSLCSVIIVFYTLKYGCKNAPLKDNMRWVDMNGVSHQHWHGAFNDGRHMCSCGEASHCKDPRDESLQSWSLTSPFYQIDEFTEDTVTATGDEFFHAT
jgi:hypothetical protein